MAYVSHNRSGTDFKIKLLSRLSPVNTQITLLLQTLKKDTISPKQTLDRADSFPSRVWVLSCTFYEVFFQPKCCPSASDRSFSCLGKSRKSRQAWLISDCHTHSLSFVKEQLSLRTFCIHWLLVNVLIMHKHTHVPVCTQVF